MACKIKTKDEWISQILSSLEYNQGCWEFKGRRNNNGYGSICTGGRKLKKDILVHRLVYEFFFGKIPKGLCVCHDCDNPSCVNPVHLFLGTNKDNMEDMAKKGRAYRAIGEKSGMCKLTTEQVTAIREDNRKQVEIAEDYGVAKSTVCMIKNRTSRKYE